MSGQTLPTPGPWTALTETWDGGDPGEPCTEVYAENGELICAVRVKDAHLIARAPDMAAALDALSTPDGVHMAILRGSIAKPTPAQIGHLYRGDDAVSVAAEVRRQQAEAFAGDEVGAPKARQHYAKGTPEGTAKAATNADRDNMSRALRALLSRLSGGAA